MFVAFLLIIFAGLAFFFIIFREEFRSGALKANSAPHLPGFGNPSEKFKAIASALSTAADAGEGPSNASGHSSQKAEQKSAKLEEMLEEKNRILARLEEDLKNEQGHRYEFDGIKEILQQEIEDLKSQNKKLKEELAQVFEENLALKSKAYGLEKARGGQQEAPFVQAETLPPALVSGALSSFQHSESLSKPQPPEA